MTSRSAENVTTGAPALEIQDVVAGYGGGDVLHGVTMQVYEGGITCVVGPNGAGKFNPARDHQRAAEPAARPGQPAR